MHIVQRGSINLYRLFDVAYEINLDEAQRLMQHGSMRRLDLRRFPKTQLSISQPPLSFELGQKRLRIEGEEFGVDVTARVFDFGVISVIMKIGVQGASLEALVPLNARVSDHPAVEQLARNLCAEVFAELGKAAQRPTLSGFVEDYTIIYVEQFRDPPPLAELVGDPALPLLIMAEQSPRGLSPEALEDAIKQSFSYYGDELAIIDWNSSFVYDPSGDSDISDLIEFASAQLLELRYYDDLLDRELARMYDDVERATGLFRQRQYRALTRRLLGLVLEVTELTEKIENSIKWVGDVYLARFYQAAVGQFNVARWQQQVERKLALMSRTNEMLSDQIATDRSQLLETMIMFLIVLELVLAFSRK